MSPEYNCMKPRIPCWCQEYKISKNDIQIHNIPNGSRSVWILFSKSNQTYAMPYPKCGCLNDYVANESKCSRLGVIQG